jgi:hypothetical protein
MKKMLLLAFTLALSANLMAGGQKYNPHSGKWETVPDNWETKYNPHDGTWSYQPKGATTIYNAHEGTWDWDSGNNPRQ